jgi:hypothetical protein
MSRIYLDASSVSSAGTTLLGQSAKLAGSGREGAAALTNTGDLPPAYRGRAMALANRMPKCTYAADALVAVGLELQKRASIAAAEDAKNFNIQPIFGRPNTLATSKALNFWNEKTRSAAKRMPGRFFDDADKILGLSKGAPVNKPAGAPKCKGVAEWDAKAIAELGGKHKKQPRSDAAKEAKRLKSRYEDQLQMMVHQYKKAGRPVPSLSPTEMKVFVGLWAQAQAGGKCTMELGDGYTATAAAVAKAVAKAGADGSLSTKGVRAALVLDASVKAEINGAIEKGNTRISAAGAGVAGLKAIAKFDVGNDKGKLNANVNVGLAVGLGLEGSVNITIDYSSIFSDPPPPPKAVGLPRADGLLVVKKAQ